MVTGGWADVYHSRQPRSTLHPQVSCFCFFSFFARCIIVQRASVRGEREMHQVSGSRGQPRIFSAVPSTSDPHPRALVWLETSAVDSPLAAERIPSGSGGACWSPLSRLCCVWLDRSKIDASCAPRLLHHAMDDKLAHLESGAADPAGRKRMDDRTRHGGCWGPRTVIDIC